MVRDIEEWYESYKTMVEKAIGKYYLLNVIYYLSPSARRLLNWCWNMAKTTIVSKNIYVVVLLTDYCFRFF